MIDRTITLVLTCDDCPVSLRYEAATEPDAKVAAELDGWVFVGEGHVCEACAKVRSDSWGEE